MQYRTFPKLPEIPVSLLGFGCMRLPTVGGVPTAIDEPAATALLRRALDEGVNYVDTAYPYHGGQSEVFVGRALRGGHRARVLLATKSPVWMVAAEGDWERFLNEQLQRLETDHVDFYLLHALSAERWETVLQHKGLEAMARFLADGRIRHLGFSFHGSPRAFETIVGAHDWAFCQLQLNYVDDEYQAGVAGLRQAAARQVGVVAMEPLRGGSIAGAVPPGVQRIWDKYPERRSAAEWALRWVWNHEAVVTALSGMNAEAQLTENLAVADAALPDALSADELALIGEAKAWYRSRTKVPCTTCGYCQPCPHGVAIPDVFSFYNTSVMFDTRANALPWYQFMLLQNNKGAPACVGCGECEPKCPQSIAIIEKLKEAHAYLMAP